MPRGVDDPLLGQWLRVGGGKGDQEASGRDCGRIREQPGGEGDQAFFPGCRVIPDLVHEHADDGRPVDVIKHRLSDAGERLGLDLADFALRETELVGELSMLYRSRSAEPESAGQDRRGSGAGDAGERGLQFAVYCDQKRIRRLASARIRRGSAWWESGAGGLAFPALTVKAVPISVGSSRMGLLLLPVDQDPLGLVLEGVQFTGFVTVDADDGPISGARVATAVILAKDLKVTFAVVTGQWRHALVGPTAMSETV